MFLTFPSCRVTITYYLLKWSIMEQESKETYRSLMTYSFDTKGPLIRQN